MKKLLLFTFSLSLAYISSAQQMSVKSFRMLENDLTAQVTDPVEDFDGKKSALIKVVTTQTGFEFDGGMLGIVKIVQKTAEVWVYVPHKAKALTIKHPQLGIIRNYAYPVPIELARTYELILVTGTVETIVKPVEVVTQWLVITSEPSEADVYINDQPAGKTPYQNELPVGKYTWRVSKELYLSEAGAIDLQEGGQKQVLNLTLKPNFGTVVVKTNPEVNAKVYVNDMDISKTTPCTLERIPSGEVKIGGRVDHYSIEPQTITVLAGKQSTVTLKADATFGTITVTSQPESGAAVSLNGVATGKTTPCTLERVSLGENTITLVKEYYETTSIKVNLAGGQTEPLKVDMKPTFGTIIITSQPEIGAAVNLNGTSTGKVTPCTLERVSLGENNITLTKEYYETATVKVNLTSGQTVPLKVEMKTTIGAINVTSSPEGGAAVTLNGMSTGKTTPCTLEKVPAGDHTVSLTREWYETKATRVTLKAGETLPLAVEMNPTFAEVNISTEPTADIYINGERKSNGTWKGRLNPAVYTFEAKLDKHTTAIEKQTVMVGKALSVMLKPIPQAGSVKVVSNPIDAAITLDGKSYGTTPNTIKDLLVGTYTLTLTKQGYGTVTKTVTIAEGKTTDITETLPSGMEVTIASTPSGAQLWINGSPSPEPVEGKGSTTPWTGTLGFGSHTLKLVNGKKEVTETITVTQGGKTRWEFDVSENAFTDNRDGKTYKTVKIGKQVWMAENLAYKPSSGNYWAYDNNSSNVNKYGYLYDWQTAKNVCPTGWHLPSDAEWTELTNFVGRNPGTKLKAKSGWSSNGNGTDYYDFSALPGGRRRDGGDFDSIGGNGYWWSSTEYYTSIAWYRVMTSSTRSVYRSYDSKSWGLSVRCLRD
jgi:uncharacterized protein (TIGR02145 family)